MSEQQVQHETIHAAMLAVWAEIPSIQKDGYNDHLKSRFTNIDTIIRTIRPILIRHGLWLSQPASVSEGGATVTTRVNNAKGETMDLGTITVPFGSMKGLSDAQAFGSALTYARRYCLCAGLGIATGEDDDGNAGSNGDSGGDRPPDPMTIKVRIQRRINMLGFKDRDEIADIVRRVRAHLNLDDDGDELDNLIRIESFLNTKNKDTIMDFLNGQ